MTQSICVGYWFIFLPYVCPFLKKLCWMIYCWLCKQNITWSRRSVRKRKAETVQSDIVGNYRRSKLPFRGICVWYWFIFLPYVCPFLKKLCWTVNWWLCKQNITRLRRSVGKRKAETVQSDTIGNNPRSKKTCRAILYVY